MSTESNSMERQITNLETEYPELTPILLQMWEQIQEKDRQIVNLENCCTDLSDRVLKLERYNSKDCLIISNFPSDLSPSITAQAVNFLNSIFKINIGCESIKACHYLGNPNAERAIVIVKFVYFEIKNIIWRSKAMLKGVTNKSNGKFIFINERLPEPDKEVHIYANKERQLKTVTDNCAVKIEVRGNNGNGTRFIEVRNKKDVDRLAADAVPRFNQRPRREANSPSRNCLPNDSYGTPVPKLKKKPDNFFATPISTSLPTLKRGRDKINYRETNEKETEIIQELRARKGNREDMLDYIMGFLGDTPEAKQSNISSIEEEPFRIENEETNGNKTLQA